MNPLEAMQTVIAAADAVIKSKTIITNAEERGELETATAIIDRMLNTALPVTRYRLYVELDGKQPKENPARPNPPIIESFTVCGVTTRSVVGGLIGLTQGQFSVRVTLWEQRETGAGMVTGYQGITKSPKFRAFIDQLAAIDDAAKATRQ